MDRLFLDTNPFIDIIKNRDPSVLQLVEKFNLYVSSVSIGNWIYIYRHKVPDEHFLDLLETYNIVHTAQDIMRSSFVGPTDDYEDNLQLHSAVKAECDLFLTKDKDLLKLGYFGKVRILGSLDFKTF